MIFYCQTMSCPSMIGGGAVDESLARQRGWVIAGGLTRGGRPYEVRLCGECQEVPF